MKRTVQSVKNSLKFKAQPKAGILSVKIGVKKYSVPVEARLLSNGEFAFLSFSASSELYQIANKQFQAMKSDADATHAFTALNPSRKRTRRRRQLVAMPDQLAEALKNLPSGYKLGYGADGSPKLVRTRTRARKAKAETAAPKAPAAKAPAAKAPAAAAKPKPAARKAPAAKKTTKK